METAKERVLHQHFLNLDRFMKTLFEAKIEEKSMSCRDGSTGYAEKQCANSTSLLQEVDRDQERSPYLCILFY